MEASVDPEACVSCGQCAELCPEVFEIHMGVAESHSTARDAPIPKSLEEDCRESAVSCPMQAISLIE
jgi:ferredoxin